MEDERTTGKPMSDTDAPFLLSKAPVLQIRLMWAFRVIVTALVALILWVVSSSMAEIKALREGLNELKQAVAVMQAEQRMRDLHR